MKKITFMLSLLMSMGAMTTSAQVLSRTGWTVTTSGECDDSNTGHAAAIIDGKNDTYWHSNWGNTNGSGDTSKKLPQFFQLDLGSAQEFQTIGYMPRKNVKDNGVVKGYKLYVSDSPFETVGNGKTAAQIVSALGAPAMEGTFSYEGENTASLKTATATSVLKGRYVLFVVTDAVATTNDHYASCAEFYLAKGATIESKTMTYHYKVDGVEYATRTISYFDASTANVPTVDYLANGAMTKTDDSNYDVACTTAYPFVAQTTFDANTAHWYSMAVRANDGNHLLAAKDNGKVGTITKELLGCPEGIGNEMQWAFVGNLKDGFTLYNKANNKQIVVKQVTETVNNKETTYTQFDLADNEGAALKLRKDNNGFGLYATEGYCFNRFDQDRIAQWEGFDDGSTFRIQEPNDYVLNYAAQYSLYDDNGAPEGAIGANSYLNVAENLNAFKTAYEAAKAGATTETLKALAAQNKKVKDGLGETIQAGKYYRLVNANSKRTLYFDASSGVMKSADNVSKSATSVVKFDNAESGRFRMKLEGKTFGKRVGNNQAITLEADNSGNKGSYKVVQVGTHFAFYDMVSNVSDRSYLHCNGSAANTLFAWDAGDINSPSRWFVIPATDVEIDMTAQGDNTYASAYLPFAVSNVAGATAYTGALNAEKNAIDMTATTAVPANIGFVLVGTADKATLTIGEAAAIEGDNALTGTNTGIAFAEATPKANYLVFGVNADKVGFYTPGNVTAIPANKAYINASAVAGSAIALNFGNTVTGINAATINNGENNAPIYDLSGRRVWAPVKGGLYIQNGKKLVK